MEEETELHGITEDKESRALTSRQSRHSTRARSTATPSKAPTPNPLRVRKIKLYELGYRVTGNCGRQRVACLDESTVTALKQDQLPL